jgi:hypothetical protein
MFIYSKIKSANTFSKKLRKDVNQQKKHLENLISKNNNNVLDIFSQGWQKTCFFLFKTKHTVVFILNNFFFV